MMELDGVPVATSDLGALALVNYGHFTSMRIEGGRVRGLDLHLSRLFDDSRRIFGVNLDIDRVRALVRKAAREVRRPVTMRVTVFDPDLNLGHPAGDAHPRVLITLRPAPIEAAPPIKLRTIRYERDLPEVKHTGLFGTVYQRRAAQEAGFDDVLFVGFDGFVTEGATWNIGFVSNGRVSWPAADCLPGVTMRLLSAAMERAGIEVQRETIALSQLAGVRAAFITNAAVGVRAVQSIDGVELGDGTGFVDRLRKEYAAIEWQSL
ncbi:aminotransferase class IV family protein [Plantactinospora sp. CA-290183]|uniref:aminotransferase class IV family protein n=1 Tax=Plantactinospora sp. CA-290183 TaxID=3240006 RepID=UPI003D8BBF4A